MLQYTAKALRIRQQGGQGPFLTWATAALPVCPCRDLPRGSPIHSCRAAICSRCAGSPIRPANLSLHMAATGKGVAKMKSSSQHRRRSEQHLMHRCHRCPGLSELRPRKGFCLHRCRSCQRLSCGSLLSVELDGFVPDPLPTDAGLLVLALLGHAGSRSARLASAFADSAGCTYEPWKRLAGLIRLIHRNGHQVVAVAEAKKHGHCNSWQVYTVYGLVLLLPKPRQRVQPKCLALMFGIVGIAAWRMCFRYDY